MDVPGGYQQQMRQLTKDIFEVLKWARERGCTWDESLCERAVEMKLEVFEVVEKAWMSMV